MGSVIDYIKCPRCGEENCIDDYYYKSGEQYINCPDCGYHKSFHYKRDNDGNLLRKDETKDYELYNLIPEEIIIDNPYGAFRVEYSSGMATCGTLETYYDYSNFVSELSLLTNQEKNDVEKVIVSKLVKDKIEKEIIFNI